MKKSFTLSLIISVLSVTSTGVNSQTGDNWSAITSTAMQATAIAEGGAGVFLALGGIDGLTTGRLSRNIAGKLSNTPKMGWLKKWLEDRSTQHSKTHYATQVLKIVGGFGLCWHAHQVWKTGHFLAPLTQLYKTSPERDLENWILEQIPLPQQEMLVKNQNLVVNGLTEYARSFIPKFGPKLKEFGDIGYEASESVIAKIVDKILLVEPNYITYLRQHYGMQLKNYSDQYHNVREGLKGAQHPTT
jgi:hypothetical protein